MLGFFNWVASKLNKSSQPEDIKANMKETVAQMDVGLMVRLKFKHPDTIGIVDHTNLSCTRLNASEVSGDRIISGTVSRRWYEPKPLDEQFIEVIVVKEHGRLRKFLFMSQEVESIEVL